MELEKRVAALEEKVSRLIKSMTKPSSQIAVKLFASNDHTELELKISLWLRQARPRIIETRFVADGAEYTYCVLFIYEPRARPLPGGRKR